MLQCLPLLLVWRVTQALGTLTHSRINWFASVSRFLYNVHEGNWHVIFFLTVSLPGSGIRMQPSSSENQLGHAPSFLIEVHMISSLNVWEDSLVQASGPKVVFLERKHSIYLRNKMRSDFSTSWVRFGNSRFLRNLSIGSQIFTFLGVRLWLGCSGEHFSFSRIHSNATLLMLTAAFSFSFMPVTSRLWVSVTHSVNHCWLSLVLVIYRASLLLQLSLWLLCFLVSHLQLLCYPLPTLLNRKLAITCFRTLCVYLFFSWKFWWKSQSTWEQKCTCLFLAPFSVHSDCVPVDSVLMGFFFFKFRYLCFYFINYRRSPCLCL